MYTKRAQRDTEFTLQQMLLSGTDAANSVCFLRCQGLDIINEELITRSERLMFKIEKIENNSYLVDFCAKARDSSIMGIPVLISAALSCMLVPATEEISGSKPCC